MDKSPDAFRTISEVADALDTPAHVLRFWETRFPQIKPVKRAGGRRYYRPSDVALLAGIKRLLHEDGMTIRGVQKVLREQGVRHVARLGAGGADMVEDSIEAQLVAALAHGRDDSPAEDAVTVEPAQVETAQIIALETVLAQKEARAAAPRSVPPAANTDQGSLFANLFDSAAEPPEAEPKPKPEAEPEPEPAPEAPMAEMVEEAAVVTPLVPPASLPPAAESAGVPPVPQPDPPFPPDGEIVVDIAPPLAGRLRALPPGALVGQQSDALILRARIDALRGRLVQATRKRPR